MITPSNTQNTPKDMPLTLEDIGWNNHFAHAFDDLAQQGWIPGRLTRETKINFTALLVDGDELDVVVSGKLWHDAATDADLPAVGDWVAIDPGKQGDEPVIRAILPRLSRFSRKEPGKSSAEQVLATNVDYVIVVTDPGADFNLRRMERYFALIQRSKAAPIVLLNKIDEYEQADIDDAVAQIQQLCPQATVIPVCSLHKKGLAPLKKYFKQGVTFTITGSSGVGKSTLVNTLLGDEWFWTGEVNEVTGKGRHTTVARELVILPQGGILIDNPGIREVQMWTDESILRESFTDLDELTHQCRFVDCKHGNDLGCALRAAVANGSLDGERYNSFLHLESEIEELKKRQKKRQMNVERVAKRDHKIKARNYEDRLDIERHHKPNLHDKHH
ncbi:MAG: ribosome small subunit-dependent GTPase A [Akkermansia sp.]